jgi:hypothetical protein
MLQNLKRIPLISVAVPHGLSYLCFELAAAIDGFNGTLGGYKASLVEVVT